MNYILNQLNSRISILRNIKSTKDLMVHYQSRLEFQLVLLLGYLWNLHIESLDDVDKENVYRMAQRPTIGDVVDMCRRLDADNLFRKNKKLAQSLNSYPGLRNSFIGHGYTYADGQDAIIKQLDELYTAIVESHIDILCDDIDFVYVDNLENNCYKGICYKSNGSVISWSCPAEAGRFKLRNLYVTDKVNSYTCISPFIEIDNFGNGMFLYCRIEEKLLGKIKYNRLLETGDKHIEWEEIANLCVTSDGTKKKTANGTIVNVYDRNYKKYIGVGIKSKLRDFLTKNMASVCATVWGHGGVGKTATVQSVCEDLANEDHKKFEPLRQEEQIDRL